MVRRKGHDPVQTYRAPDELVAEARKIADTRHESVSDVVRAALQQYVKRYGKEQK